MDSNNHNNDGANSKIEKIRIDLEKKLAALEAAKIKTTQRKSINQDNTNNSKIKPIKTSVDGQDDINKSIDNQRFIEQISSLEIINVPKKDETSIKISKENEQPNAIGKKVVVDDTLFEIHDTIESIKEKIADVEKIITKENVISNEIQTTTKNTKPVIVEDIRDNESIGLTAIPKIKKTKIIESKVEVENTMQKTTASSKSKVVPVIDKIQDKEVKVNNEIIEEEIKKSNLNYIIYALAGIIILAVSYMSWSYLSNSSSSNGNKILSEYENRRYKDSIELADLSNQLLDFQSQRYIDSIANVNQIQLENRSSKNNLEKTFANNVTTTTTNDLNDSNNFKQPVQQIIISNDSNNDIVTDNNTRLDNEVISNNDNNIILETSPFNNSDTISETSEQLIIGEEVVVDETENIEEVTDTKSEEKINKTEESKTETQPKTKKTETLSTIDKSPIFPGCEGESTELLKKRCLMSKISKFVSNKFNSDLSQDLGLEEGRKKINVSFIIDKFGGVTVLKVRGQHKVLEKEALRVVNSLPKMKPGQKNGNAEPVLYNLPIIYKVEY